MRASAPRALNTDHGSQLTSEPFIGLLKQHGIQNQHGRQGLLARQRVRRADVEVVKYEEVYLRAYESVSHARSSLDRYFAFYNAQRPHTALERQMPDQVYFPPQPISTAA